MPEKPTYEELVQRVRELERAEIENKKIEKALKENESRYRDLFENLYDGVAVYTAENDGNDFRFVDMNEAGQFLSNVKKEDIIGKSVARLFPGIKELGLFDVFQRVYRTGKTEKLPMTQYKDSRISQWVDNTVFKLPSGDIVAVYRDETAQRRAEQGLQDSEIFLRSIVNQSPFATWISDSEGTLQQANPALKKFLNLTDDQLVGKYNVLKDPLVERQGLLPLIRTVYEDGKSISFICDWDGNDIPTMDLKGSSSVSIEATMFPIHNPEGELTNVVLNWIDITDRKHAEKEIRELNRNLELRVLQRTALLEETNKELEDFVYSVSHDLRAPLRSISGFAEIIDRRHKASLNEEGRHYFDNIVNASRQMGALIDDLLNFSRLGRKAIKLEPIPLDDVLKAAVETLSDPIKETDTRINLPGQMPMILGDLTLSTHIFINLIENAVKYHKPDVALHIDVSFEVKAPHVIISVADNGIGIAQEYHEKIFNIFQRLHNQSEYPGTGIGLAAVKKAVQMMGGRVWVESELGKGSVFKIKIPMAIST